MAQSVMTVPVLKEAPIAVPGNNPTGINSASPRPMERLGAGMMTAPLEEGGRIAGLQPQPQPRPRPRPQSQPDTSYLYALQPVPVPGSPQESAPTPAAITRIAAPPTQPADIVWRLHLFGEGVRAARALAATGLPEAHWFLALLPQHLR
jgi:hypothetical protein